MQKLNTLGFTNAEEPDYVRIHKRYLSKFQHYGRRARGDLFSQVSYVLRSNSADQFDDGAVVSKNLLNLQSHSSLSMQWTRRPKALE